MEIFLRRHAWILTGWGLPLRSAFSAFRLPPSAFRLPFAFCLLFLLAGCLDYDEDLTLHGNGSGEFNITVAVDERLLANDPEAARRFTAEEARREFEKTEGVKLDDATVVREGGRLVLRLRGSFRSLPELVATRRGGGGGGGNGAEPDPTGFLGKISYQEDGRRVLLSRVIDLGGSRLFPGGGSGEQGAADALAQGLFAAMFADHYLNFRAHFPAEIVAANAARLDPKTRTVEWRFPLAQALRESPVLTVELRRPNPFVPWLVGAVLFVPVALAAWALFGRKAKPST